MLLTIRDNHLYKYSILYNRRGDLNFQDTALYIQVERLISTPINATAESNTKLGIVIQSSNGILERESIISEFTHQLSLYINLMLIPSRSGFWSIDIAGLY